MQQVRQRAFLGLKRDTTSLATSFYVFLCFLAFICCGIQSQGGVAGVASKWQQVPVAMVNLGSLGMAPEQAVLRRQLPSMQ